MAMTKKQWNERQNMVCEADIIIEMKGLKQWEADMVFRQVEMAVKNFREVKQSLGDKKFKITRLAMGSGPVQAH